MEMRITSSLLCRTKSEYGDTKQMKLNEEQFNLVKDFPCFSETPTKTKKRANELDGKNWTRYSISIWSDIRKSPEEMKLGHPAIFPVELVRRLLQCFTTQADLIVLDPFAGVGSTLVAAQIEGRKSIGIELNSEYVEKMKTRLEEGLFINKNDPLIYNQSIFDLPRYVGPESIDFVVTSPPYWNILTEKRSADHKAVRNYGESGADLGRVADYHEFLDLLAQAFKLVFSSLKKGKYCCVVVMDLRKKDKFYPFHSDVAYFMQKIGFIYDDMIIWDRRHEYNNMRPLGYPSVFRINKAHEFILIFQKPKT